MSRSERLILAPVPLTFLPLVFGDLGVVESLRRIVPDDLHSQNAWTLAAHALAPRASGGTAAACLATACVLVFATVALRNGDETKRGLARVAALMAAATLIVAIGCILDTHAIRTGLLRLDGLDGYTFERAARRLPATVNQGLVAYAASCAVAAVLVGGAAVKASRGAMRNIVATFTLLLFAWVAFDVVEVDRVERRIVSMVVEPWHRAGADFVPVRIQYLGRGGDGWASEPDLILTRDGAIEADGTPLPATRVQLGRVMRRLLERRLEAGQYEDERGTIYERNAPPFVDDRDGHFTITVAADARAGTAAWRALIDAANDADALHLSLIYREQGPIIPPDACRMASLVAEPIEKASMTMRAALNNTATADMVDVVVFGEGGEAWTTQTLARTLAETSDSFKPLLLTTTPPELVSLEH